MRTSESQSCWARPLLANRPNRTKSRPRHAISAAPRHRRRQLPFRFRQVKAGWLRDLPLSAAPLITVDKGAVQGWGESAYSKRHWRTHAASSTPHPHTPPPFLITYRTTSSPSSSVHRPPPLLCSALLTIAPPHPPLLTCKVCRAHSTLFVPTNSCCPVPGIVMRGAGAHGRIRLSVHSPRWSLAK